MKQYRQLLGETADAEQSDTDEMEIQLAALVESQHARSVSLLLNPSTMLGFKFQMSAAIRSTKFE